MKILSGFSPSAIEIEMLKTGCFTMREVDDLGMHTPWLNPNGMPDNPIVALREASNATEADIHDTCLHGSKARVYGTDAVRATVHDTLIPEPCPESLQERCGKCIMQLLDESSKQVVHACTQS